MPVTRDRLGVLAGRRGRCSEEEAPDWAPAYDGEPCGPALEAGVEPEGVGALEDDGAGAGGGATRGGGGGRGVGTDGTVSAGTGGAGGSGGGGGGAGGTVTVVVVVVGSGSETVGSETVGSPTWPNACAVSTPTRPPATASTARTTAVLTFRAIL